MYGATRRSSTIERKKTQVLTATSTSKSQLFHYFPDGRAGLLVAVARFEAELVMEAQRPFIDDLSTVESWHQWRDAVVRHYAELGERCPLGALTSELGASSSETRSVVSDLLDQWAGALMTGVQALITARSAPAELPIRDTSRTILTAVQGGVVMLRTTGRLTYLETALQAALRPLLQSTPSPGTP